MSGENLEEPQDPIADATADAPGGEQPEPSPAATGVEPFVVPAPESVAIPDAEAAIQGFEVPPPPAFSAASPPSSPPVIPPAPSESTASDVLSETPALRERSTWVPDDTWTSASAHAAPRLTAAEKAASRAAASRAATAHDEASRARVYPVAGEPAENSYRGWTVTIFVGLTVLLIAAIAGIAYLATNAPLSFPDAAEDPAPVMAVSPEPAETVAEEQVAEEEEPEETISAPSGRCDELCADVAASVGDEIASADGANVWRLSEAWETADSATLSATETAQAEYESTAGALVFTVWGFESDAAADDAYVALVDERGEPDYTDSVYENGRGVRNDFSGARAFSTLWSVTGDETQPWVLQVEGSDGDAVTQFYLALPI